MSINLRGRSLLTLRDFTPEEIIFLIDSAVDLKSKKRSGIRGEGLKGKNIILIFEKASTRTRCAFEVAVYDEGGCVTFLTNSQMGRKESIEDTARVLGRYYDGIEFRGFHQKTVETLAEFSGVPVWNGLTDLYHPTQVLADLMTLREHTSKSFRSMKLVFIGDAHNNMGNSLLIGAAQTGMTLTAIAPPSLFPAKDIIDYTRQVASETGAEITITDDVFEGIKGADAIYTDVWASLGEEDRLAERIAMLKPYKVDKNIMEKTGNSETLFMHCLPAFHDEETEIGRKAAIDHNIDSMEVSDEVFRSSRSVVFDQAENRMHTIKSVILATIGN